MHKNEALFGEMARLPREFQQLGVEGTSKKLIVSMRKPHWRSMTTCATMYITLPSNFVETGYKNNKNSSYTTSLSEPLDVRSKYLEVGLPEIQYTTSWKNVADAPLELSLTSRTGSVDSKSLKILPGCYHSQRNRLRVEKMHEEQKNLPARVPS